MIKRTITTFAVTAYKLNKKTAEREKVTEFQYVGGTAFNETAARSAYDKANGKRLPRGCALIAKPISREIWGMDTAEFMTLAHKLSDAEIAQDSED